MKTLTPLFVTGLARSGTTLLARMLSVHPDVMVASDPYLPLFLSIRNAVLRKALEDGAIFEFDFTSPLQDYYFSDDKIKILNILDAANLNLSANRVSFDNLSEKIKSRTVYECPDILSYLNSVKGNTYKELLDYLLNVITRARNCEQRKWVGIKELWVIDFIPMLSRAYPEARFIIIQRDPRDILASMLGVAKKDPSQRAHNLSFLRHWRKYAAYTYRFLTEPGFKERVLSLCYEKLVTEPEEQVKKMCAFLDIQYNSAMLNVENYRDYSTGLTWKGNSSFVERLPEISRQSVGGWKQKLPSGLAKMTDFVCGPDMALCGYRPETCDNSTLPETEMIQAFFEGNEGKYSWRSDFQDPQKDLGFELFRKLLLQPEYGNNYDSALIRRSFLFEPVYHRLKTGQSDIKLC